MRKVASSIWTILLVIGLMAFGAFAEIESAKVEFDPLATNTVSQTIDLTGEVLQLGIRSSLTNAFDLTIADFYTGATIYSATNLTATSYNLVPRVAATDSAGATATNTLGKIYVPPHVSKIKVTAGNSNTTNDSLTIFAIVNNSP